MHHRCRIAAVATVRVRLLAWRAQAHDGACMRSRKTSVERIRHVSISIDGVDGEEWAQRIGRLSADERTRRIDAVNVLLSQPDEISDPLESELYVLRSELQRPDTAD